MKRVLLLGDANSSHMLKWASGVVSSGYEVKLFSLTPYSSEVLQESGVDVVCSSNAGKNKLLYPLAINEVKKLIREFKPDILHAHYASSYGLLGALSGFHPFVMSVWGSDVYSFPKISPLHKWIFKFNLRKADRICSTSNTMKEEIKKYTGKDISVIPFGIDLNVFKPFYAHHVFKDDSIVVGTVKTLEIGYGIEYLVDAFALLKKKLRGYPVKLLIVGKGSLDGKLRGMVKDLGIESETVFTGYVSPAEIPFYQNMLTIAVFPSLYESFGVSVVEAMACEKPVVVTNVGGLPEVVEEGVTGLIVPPQNAEKLEEAIEKLVKDKQLREQLGKQGRQRAERIYNWENNLAEMMGIYDKLLTAGVK
jgi:L-malate glycosyltransferase